MTRIATFLGASVASGVLAFLAAFGWWRAWMYHGWIGPPRFLHPIWPGLVDGEASYDIAFYEMFVVSLLAFLLLLLMVRRHLSTHAKGSAGSTGAA